MKLSDNILDYEVATKNQVYNEPEDLTEEEYEDILAKRCYEQNEVLENAGFPGGASGDNDTSYLVHFFGSIWCHAFLDNCTLMEAIEALCIKDGVDLVKFENGNYGFVAYYNGISDAFEIICPTQDLEATYNRLLADGEIEDEDNDFDCFIEETYNLENLVREL